MEAVLIRLQIDGGVILEVDSTGPGNYLSLKGSQIDDVLTPSPASQKFVPASLTIDGDRHPAAARLSGQTCFVYLLPGMTGMSCPGTAWLRLVPGAVVPVASPALVALLGYTPWELAGTDLLRMILTDSECVSYTTSVLDRWGSRKDLLCSCSRSQDGARWISIMPLPEGERVSLEEALVRWEGQPIVSAQEELGNLLEASGISAGAVVDRSVQPFAVIAESGLSLSEEDSAPGGLLSSWVSGSILWVDSEETPDERGNTCVAPFGRSERYLAVLGGVQSPVEAEHRLKVLLPVLAMRLDLWAHCRSGAELEGRRALLDDFERSIQEHGVSSWQGLSPVLAEILPETGAVSAAVFAGPDEQPLAAAGESSPPSIHALHAGHGDVFQAVIEVRLRNGHRLCAGFDREAAADHALFRALGRMLERYCRDQSSPAPAGGGSFGTLPIALVRDFRVVWQGGALSLAHCHEFYGFGSPCEGCPLLSRQAEEAPKHMRLARADALEEIFQTPDGQIVLWLKAPQAPPAQKPTERIPGGWAVYDSGGTITLWSSWFEAATGAASSTAEGQWAGRLVEKLGSDKLSRQFELSLRGVFMQDSVEFRFEGRRCASRICQGPGGSIHHFILDTVSAGLGDLRLLSGPGVVSQADPSSVASSLSAACELLGWELDMSPAVSEDSSRVWLSQPALSGLLLEILKVLASSCPERWVALDSVSYDEKPFRGGRAFLPGRYLTLQFGIHPVLLASQLSALTALDREMSALGGWTARSESKEALTLAFPSAIGVSGGETVGVYGGDEYFEALLDEVRPSLPGACASAATLSELAAIQPDCALLAVRLKPGELELAAALAGRAPWQGLLLATGLQPQIPLFASRIELLQLPATPEEVLSSIRRMLVV